MLNTPFDYRTTFAVVPPAFPDYERIAEDLSRVSPKSPKGDGWRLVSSATVFNERQECTVLYFWERAARERNGSPDRGFPSDHGFPSDPGFPSDHGFPAD